MGEAKHSRVKSIPCPHCQKMFSRKGHMTEHVRTVHEGKKRIYKEVKSNATSLFSELNISLEGELSTLWQNFPAQVGFEHSHILGARRPSFIPCQIIYYVNFIGIPIVG